MNDAPKNELVWLYYENEYPDEGAVFPFATEAEAEAHASDAGYQLGAVTVESRRVTEEEQTLIDYGRHWSDSTKAPREPPPRYHVFECDAPTGRGDAVSFAIDINEAEPMGSFARRSDAVDACWDHYDAHPAIVERDKGYIQATLVYAALRGKSPVDRVTEEEMDEGAVAMAKRIRSERDEFRGQLVDARAECVAHLREIGNLRARIPGASP